MVFEISVKGLSGDDTQKILISQSVCEELGVMNGDTVTVLVGAKLQARHQAPVRHN